VDESKIDERTGPSEARSGNSDRAGDARVASDGAGAEKQSEGTRSAELLMGLVEGARIFRAADGRFHARVAIEGQNELIGLRSKAFRDWLVDRFVSAYRKLPPSRAVQRVLEALEARARFDVDRPLVYVRVGRGRDENEESFYLDLGDRAGRAVRICGSGWSVVDEAGIHFSRPHGQLPLPVPSHDGSIELLKPFVNVSPSDFHLLITWLAAALRPAGPYPVLAIRGEQGSAKSTLAKVVRQLVDPQSAPLLGEPGSTTRRIKRTAETPRFLRWKLRRWGCCSCVMPNSTGRSTVRGQRRRCSQSSAARSARAWRHRRAGPKRRARWEAN
jgi:hypothetical protein